MSTDYDRKTEDIDVTTEDAASPVDGVVMHDDTMHDDTMHDDTMHDDTMDDSIRNDDTLDDGVVGGGTYLSQVPVAASLSQVPVAPSYQDSAAEDQDDEKSFTPSVEAPSAEAPGTELPTAAAPGTSVPDENLLGDTTELVTQWKHAQAEFLDDPHAAITEAADVVAEAAGRLEAALRARRSTWDDDGKPDTETLRQGMLEYRRLFDMLVS